MSLPARLLPALVVGAALLAPAAASAADAPAACPLASAPVAVEHPVAGTPFVARDPYGGRLARNRLFFDFSLRGPQASLGDVAKVTWALDGTVVREDPTAPFEWKGLSGSTRRMPAGDHTITVTVVPQSGDPASVSFPLTATDCQPVTFNAEVARRSGPSTFSWGAAFESRDGEPLTAVAATSRANVAATLPARLVGRRVGTVTIAGARGAGRTYRLTAPATAGC